MCPIRTLFLTPVLVVAASLLVVIPSGPNRADDAVQAGQSAFETYASFMAQGPISDGERLRLGQAWQMFVGQYPNDWSAQATQLIHLADAIEQSANGYPRARIRDALAAEVYCPLPVNDPYRGLQAALESVVSAHVPVVAKICRGTGGVVATRSDVHDFIKSHRFFSRATGIETDVWIDEIDRVGIETAINEWSTYIAQNFTTTWDEWMREHVAHASTRWKLTKAVWAYSPEAQRQQLLAAIADIKDSQGWLATAVFQVQTTLVWEDFRIGLEQNLVDFLRTAGRTVAASTFSHTALTELQTWGE
jgi:hypothetical protein